MVDQKNKSAESHLASIELMYFAYRGFTQGADQLLAVQGLNRVHHRILYFVARNPGLSVAELLQILQVSKQAINQPMRELLARALLTNARAEGDKRRRELRLTNSGAELEAALTQLQSQQFQRVIDTAGRDALAGWAAIMSAFKD